MTFLTALGGFNYGLVLIYGLFLSAHIAGGLKNRQQKRLILVLCPLFLLIQTPCWLIFGENTTKQLYPLIVHLPLVLILIFALKKRQRASHWSVYVRPICAVSCLGGRIWQSLLSPVLPWWGKSATHW